MFLRSPGRKTAPGVRCARRLASVRWAAGSTARNFAVSIRPLTSVRRTVNAVSVCLCLVVGSGCEALLRPSVEIGVRSGRAELVSPIRLIAEPEAYDGHQVFVGGVLRYEFESYVLYVSMEDYVWRRFWNGVEVRFKTSLPNKQLESLNGRQVLVDGRFIAAHEGNWFGPNGTIVDIESVETWDRVD